MLKYFVFFQHRDTPLSVGWSSLWRLCTQAVDFFFLDQRPPPPPLHYSWAPWSSSAYIPACLDRLVDCSYLLLGAFSWLGHGTGLPLADQTSHWTASFYLNRCRNTFYSGGTFSWWKSISAVLFHFIQTIFLGWDIKTVNMCIYIYVCYCEDDCLLRYTSRRFLFFSPLKLKSLFRASYRDTKRAAHF